MVNKVLEKFKKSTLYHEMEAHEAAQTQAERERLVGEITVIREAEEKAVPVRTDKVAKARAAVDKAQKALAETEKAYRVLYAEDQRARRNADIRIGQFEMQLRQSAPESIDQFIREMMDLEERTRQHYRPVTMIEQFNLTLRERQRVSVTDWDLLQARLQTIREARQEAESLKVSSHPNILARLEELRREL